MHLCIEKMLRKELPPEAYINGLYDGDIATEVSRDMNRGEKVTLEELKNLILEKNKINVPNYSAQSSEIEWTEQNTENVQNNNWSNVKTASEDFLKNFDDESIDGVLYDPPYSPRQVSECYNDFGYNVTWDTTKASFWGNHKKEISRIVKIGGKVITFGWNSGGIGYKYGFEIERILLSISAK